MLPVSALVRDENMAEFTERLTLEDFSGTKLRLRLRLAAKERAAKERAAKALLRIYYEMLIDLEVRKE